MKHTRNLDYRLFEHESYMDQQRRLERKKRAAAFWFGLSIIALTILVLIHFL